MFLLARRGQRVSIGDGLRGARVARRVRREARHPRRETFFARAFAVDARPLRVGALALFALAGVVRGVRAQHELNDGGVVGVHVQSAAVMRVLARGIARLDGPPNFGVRWLRQL